jgi:tetratricopeptide (TPR) repeat protein
MKSCMAKAFNLLVATFVLSATLVAQNAQDGFKMLAYEQYDEAIKLFENLLKANPSSAENQFYLGHAYTAANKGAEALDAYGKVAALDPKSPFVLLANGRIAAMKKDHAAAQKAFDDVIKATKRRDANIFRLVGETYLYPAFYTGDTSKLRTGLGYLNEALAIDGKNPVTYMSLGMTRLLLKDAGGAATAFDFVESFDAKNPLPAYKTAMMFKSFNPAEFVKRMEKALALDPKMQKAHRELGYYYFSINQFPKAKEAFGRLIENGGNSIEDRSMYAKLLYLTKNYQQAVPALQALYKEDPKQTVVLRLLGYCYYEMNDYPQSIANLEQYLAKAAKADVGVEDFDYYAKALEGNKQDSMAILAYQKVLELNPAKTEYYGKIAETYYKQKKYADAAKFYTVKMQKLGENATDLYDLGRSYFFGKEFKLADSMFAKVIAINPVPNAYFYRARCNERFDPDAYNNPALAKQFGLAAPHYLKFIEVTAAEREKYTKDLLKAHKYLVFYYTFQESRDLAIEQCRKILELDPNNTEAIETIKSLEAGGKPAKPGQK